jgi:hypothetical protein
MKFRLRFRSSRSQRILDARLAAYLASAGALGTAVASEAEAVVVGNTTVQPFGVNGVVSIDFNMDGQIDFQVDHDRVDLTNMGGGVLDYLQIDKNDINGETNPLPFDPIAGGQAATFPPNMTTPNDANESAYVINPNMQGSYPAALTFGTPIGPTSSFDWQESNNFQSGGKWIRANRLMDEDATTIDQVLGGRPATGVQVPFNGPNFDALGGDVRYLGLKMDLNNTNLINYGWVGVRITNEADATGEVVGWAYQTAPGVPILAGAIPEPSTMLAALFGGATLVGCFLGRRRRCD